MAESIAALKLLLSDPLDGDAQFRVLQDIADLVNRDADSPDVRDLVIRLQDSRSNFALYSPVVDALLDSVGLLPYVAPRSIGLRASTRVALNQPVGMEVVLHRVQAQVYRELIAGRNVILSAPTSFGKSLLFDAVVASGKYDNLMLLLPTIALMDEARRRLSSYDGYKVITHASQRPGARNIYVMTQERIIGLEKLPAVDFFMLDEFYKLDDDTDRGAVLNAVFYRLVKSGAQYYLAGPNVHAISRALPARVQASFFSTDFETVAIDIVRVDADTDSERESSLIGLLSEVAGPSIVYCQSPGRANHIAAEIRRSRKASASGMVETADWLDGNLGSGWAVSDALRVGVGVHHGQLPRWLGQEIVRGFNDGELDVLVCTSTLIEGVNTRAKNVFILDKKIATSAYDYFTFANIRGRGGRMFEHFVGKAYLFHEPPVPVDLSVDFPVLSQAEGSRPDVLLAIDPTDRRTESTELLRVVERDSPISLDVLRRNIGVPLDMQVEFARAFEKLSAAAKADIVWTTAYPKYRQLLAVLDLVWNELAPNFHSSKGAFSSKQLTFFLFELQKSEGALKSLVDRIQSDTHSPTGRGDAIERAVKFVRFWMDHNLPSRLRAASLILRDGLGYPVDFGAYAARVETMFDRPYMSTMEELGLPLQVVQKIRHRLEPSSTLDDMVAQLRDVARTNVGELTPYESTLLHRATARPS